MDKKNCLAIPRGTDSDCIVEVIRTKSLSGAGTQDSPAKTVIQYWTLEGKLIATVE